MDESNLSTVVKLARNPLDISKVHLIRNSEEQKEKDVPDPYYGGDFGFRNVYKMLDEACEIIAKNINPNV